MCIINTRYLSINVSSSDVYKLMFYLTIVNRTHVTVTLGWRDSSINRSLRSSECQYAECELLCRRQS